MLGIEAEAAVFLYAGLSGMTVMFGYDILICLRKIIPHGMAAVNAEDLIFWAAASVYLFAKMYDTTYGAVRWFFILGVVCGTALGYLAGTLGKKISVKFKKKLEKFRKSR